MRELLRLPLLGEGIETGTLVALYAEAGMPVKQGQLLFEVEIDKVTVEVPSPHDGRLIELFVGPGERVSVGQRLAAIEQDSPTGRLPPAPETEQKSREPYNQDREGKVLSVASGRKSESAWPAFQPSTVSAERQRTVPAGPAARRMARELGVDIREIPGSGSRGRIDRQDVIDFARRRLESAAGARPSAAPDPLPDLARFGSMERVPLTVIQQATARNMARAWREIPHAWLQERIDVTALEQRRQAMQEEPNSRASITITPYIVRAVALALQRHPLFNAALDPVARQVVHRRYINIGVAVDTPRGLLVPVIGKADRKPVEAIAEELADLALRAREDRLQLWELQGAGITLTNLGGMGVDILLPIINWPQSAIVGTGTASWHQVRDGQGEWRERLLMPVTLAFDHRLINGADAARFLADLKSQLE